MVWERQSLGVALQLFGLWTLFLLTATFGTSSVMFGKQKQNKAKVKQTKKQQHVAVGVCCFLFFFRFLTRNVQRILLTVKRSHTCRSGTRKNAKKRQHKCKNKANCAAFAFSFAFVLLFFPALFSQKNIFDGWSCMAAIAEHNSSGFILFAF